jgi:hypothetical protein
MIYLTLKSSWEKRQMSLGIVFIMSHIHKFLMWANPKVKVDFSWFLKCQLLKEFCETFVPTASLNINLNVSPKIHIPLEIMLPLNVFISSCVSRNQMDFILTLFLCFNSEIWISFLAYSRRQNADHKYYNAHKFSQSQLSLSNSWILNREHSCFA